MDRDIQDMVAGNVELMKIVVERETDVGCNRRSKRIPKSPVLILPAGLQGVVIRSGFIKDPFDDQL